MSNPVNLLDVPLCPACAAPWAEDWDDEQCAECGFESGEPVVLRQLFEAEPLAVEDESDWNDLRALARIVAQATLDNPEEVRRLLDGVNS